MKTKTNDLTIPQFAKAMHVSRITVSRWVKSGKVKAYKKGPFPGRTSPILIPASELERVKKLAEDKGQTNEHFNLLETTLGF